MYPCTLQGIPHAARGHRVGRDEHRHLRPAWLQEIVIDTFVNASTGPLARNSALRVASTVQTTGAPTGSRTPGIQCGGLVVMCCHPPPEISLALSGRFRGAMPPFRSPHCLLELLGTVATWSGERTKNIMRPHLTNQSASRQTHGADALVATVRAVAFGSFIGLRSVLAPAVRTRGHSASDHSPS